MIAYKSLLPRHNQGHLWKVGVQSTRKRNIGVFSRKFGESVLLMGPYYWSAWMEFRLENWGVPNIFFFTLVQIRYLSSRNSYCNLPNVIYFGINWILKWNVHILLENC
jgi:hypothetical protein